MIKFSGNTNDPAFARLSVDFYSSLDVCQGWQGASLSQHNALDLVQQTVSSMRIGDSVRWIHFELRAHGERWLMNANVNHKLCTLEILDGTP